MKVFEIKHRFTEKILFRAETESLKSCLEAGIGMGADLKDSDLRYSDLRDSDLRGANLRYANLRDSDLRNANLIGADLRSANLRYADLRDSDLRYSDLRSVDLISANLRDADLRYADLRGVDLRGVDLRGVDLRDAYIQDSSSETIKIKETPLQILGMSWDIIVFDSHMKIGCEFHSIKDWSEYDDERIERMHNEAKEWWGNHKKMIMDFCDMNERR